MVGSDAIGKLTVALELDREARARGIRSEFVPTGQTGIAIAGWGISVDAVVADFIAGAAEQLVLEGVRRGGEVLFVEGQGSLLHPAYSGVTLGLIHGSAPHAYVLCHKADERFVDGDERYVIPPLSELVDLHERVSLLARPARVAAIALNTRRLDEPGGAGAIAAAGAETGLPADDPVRFGPSRLRRGRARRARSSLTGEHVFATLRTHVRSRACPRRSRAPHLERRRAAVGRPRAQDGLPCAAYDSLWTIASKHHGGDVRESVWQIESANAPRGPGHPSGPGPRRRRPERTGGSSGRQRVCPAWRARGDDCRPPGCRNLAGCELRSRRWTSTSSSSVPPGALPPRAARRVRS
jgi:hypothetical protein